MNGQTIDLCGTPTTCDVLVVDDEVFITRLLKRLLTREGISVYTSNDSVQALTMLRNFQPRIIISDQKMPKMKGIEFFEQSKQIQPDSLRILLTGNGDLNLAQEAINRVGIYRFLSKPWDNQEMLKLVQDGLAHVHLMEENKKLSEKIENQNQELFELNCSLKSKVLERTVKLEDSLKELERLSNFKSDFIANVSHELRTPLTAILGYLELIKDGIYGPVPGKQKEILKDISINTDILLTLVNNILDSASLEAGKMIIHPEFFSLTELSKEIVDLFKPLYQRKNLDFIFNCDDDDLMMHSDKDKIRRILVNIISNAIKYTAEGSVTFSVKKNLFSESIIIEVSDTGIGIESENIAHIFERFETIQSQNPMSSNSTGIGLALSKEFTELLGGKLMVESQISQGTVMTIILLREITEHQEETKSDRLLNTVFTENQKEEIYG